MSESTPEVAPVTAQEPTIDPVQVETPPWGTDFDPEKAWKLVQNLRADKDKLAARPGLTEEQQRQLNEYNKLVEASKSEAQRKDEAVAVAQRERDEAIAEKTRYTVALKHGITEEDFDLLGSGSAEQIEARAVRVAAKNEAAKQAALETVAATPTARRPVEQLRAGATPAPDPAASKESLYPASWHPAN